MKTKYWIVLAAAIVSAMESAACSSDFHSCYQTRTCPVAGRGGAAVGEAGSNGDDAGSPTGDGAGVGGTTDRGGTAGDGEAGTSDSTAGQAGAAEDGCKTNADCGGTTPVCNLDTKACEPRPSCAGLTPTCGPAANGDCCASTEVPGGLYLRSFDGATYADNGNPASVSPFRLDNYEITVGRFRKFVAAYSPTMIPSGAGKNENNVADSGWNPNWNSLLPTNSAALVGGLAICAGDGPGWHTWPSGKENLPINCISWYEAQAFCIWDGGRLPTEAEWNYVATGGSEQRAYPWGAEAPGTTANRAAFGCYYANTEIKCTGWTNIAPVGKLSMGVGRWGQSDLAGNLREWTQDFHSAAYPNPCSDCADLEGTSRTVRGGDFRSPATAILSSVRAFQGETEHNDAIGARCARAL